MILGGYRALRLVPGGSIGCAYQGLDRRGRGVFLKVLPAGTDPRQLDSLRRLLSAQSAVTHPGILAPIELLEVACGLVIVSELVRAGSLARQLARRGGMAAPAVVRGAALVADALAALHADGFVHGGVKPSNLLLMGSGPALTDTGAGWWTGAATKHYQAPEQAAGEQAGPESDVYALGVTCWESLARRPPDPSSRRRGPAPGAPGAVPAELSEVLVASVSSRPADRPTASQLSEELERLSLSTRRPLAAPPAPPAPPASPLPAPPAPPLPAPPASPLPAHRKRRVGLLVTAGVVALCVGAAVRFVDGGGHSAVRTGQPLGARISTGCGAERPAAATATIVARVAGAGCARIAWSNGTLTVGSWRQYVLGSPGDELLVGDWACQGEDTPALYRPSTGQVFIWSSWASPAHALAPQRVLDTGVRNGAAVATVAGFRRPRCEQVSVRPEKSQ